MGEEKWCKYNASRVHFVQYAHLFVEAGTTSDYDLFKLLSAILLRQVTITSNMGKIYEDLLGIYKIH